jgi:hypothetical protein
MPPAVRVAGDPGQGLLLDHPENGFYFSPPHRAPGLAAGQPDAGYRAGPLQRRTGKRRPVVAVQTGRDAAAGDRGAEHAGEPDGVGAADEPGPGQEPGPVIDDARQKGRLPAGPRAVHEVRGPDLVHRTGLEPAERLRRRPARPGGQLPGLQLPLDGPQRRDGAALRGQDRRTCAAVRAGFSIFSPAASSPVSVPSRGGHCRGAGTSASNPPALRAVIVG